ncbi:B12-binding domain-containing radical SAM protein [archaeon]|nr:B12-binding domain-containing radical SAM protein [archaeon]
MTIKIKEEKDVLLINPLLHPIEFETPLGMLYLATVLAENFCGAKILDFAFEKNYSKLKKELKVKDYKVVGIYSMSGFYTSAEKVAKMVKKLCPETFLIIGGPHATIFPEEILQNKLVDGVVIGEGEKALPKIIDAIKKKKNFENINNFYYKKQNNIIKSRKESLEIKNIPIPNRYLLDNLEQYKFSKEKMFGYKALNMIASRGCPFTCEFCQPMLQSMFGTKTKLRNPREIIKEIYQLKSRYGVEAIWFSDDTFTFDKNWVHDICKEIIKQKIEIKWSCNSRVDTVDEKLLKHMAKAGCIQIRYGVESGSDIISQGSLGKKITAKKTRKAFALADKYKINTWAYTMLGGPEETEETFEETKKLLREIKPVHIQLTITTPLPGTYYYKNLDKMDITLRRKPFGKVDLFRDSITDSKKLSHKKIKRMYKGFRKEFKQYYLERIKHEI